MYEGGGGSGFVNILNGFDVDLIKYDIFPVV